MTKILTTRANTWPNLTGPRPRLALFTTREQPRPIRMMKKRRKAISHPPCPLIMPLRLLFLQQAPQLLFRSLNASRSSDRSSQSKESKLTVKARTKKSSLQLTSRVAEARCIHQKFHNLSKHQNPMQLACQLLASKKVWPMKNRSFWWTLITLSSGIESIRNSNCRKSQSYKPWKSTAFVWFDRPLLFI